MKELWTANQFHLMNRPFAEMGYNSSGLNIAPSAFCWQLAGPSRTIRLLPAHHPSTLCAPPADAPQTISNTRHNIWRPPQAICRRSAQHLAAPCTASAISPQTIRHLAARHPLPCAASVGSLQAICPPAHRAMPAGPSQAICRRSAQHLAVPCTASAISPQTIRHRTAQHPPTPARHPLAPCRQSAGTNRCP